MGYNAFRELGIMLVLAPTCFGPMALILYWIDTSGFTEPTRLLSSLNIAELATAAHPDVAAAPVAYAALLGAIHFWSIHWAVDVAHVTWQLWNSGLRSGARQMLLSPDTKHSTVVSFACPATQHQGHHHADGL